MNETSVTIYYHLGRGAFLHGDAKTTMGVFVAAPPFIAIPVNKLGTDLWRQVKAMLFRETPIISHPDKFDQLGPLLELAQCKSWKDFAKKSAYCRVTKTDQQVEVVTGTWDGTGFAHSLCDQIRLPISMDADIESSIFKAIGFSPT
jgi:hypothetical protein